MNFLKNNDLILSSLLGLLIRAVAVALSFGVNVVIGRVLGVSESGFFFLAFNVLTFLAVFSRVGLDNTVLRYTGSAFPEENWGVVRGVLARAVLIVCFASGFISAALYFFREFLAESVFFKPELAPVLGIMAPGIMAVSLLAIIGVAFQGLRRLIASVVFSSVVTNFFLVVGLLSFGVSTAEKSAWVYTVSAYIALFAGAGILVGALGAGDGAPSWSDIFHSCLPLWLLTLMSQLIQFSGQFVAGGLLDAEEVAQLAAAQRTAMLISFILTVVNLVVAPRFAAMYKLGALQEMESLALASVRLMLFCSLPVLAVILIFPAALMGIFGAGFEEGSHLLQILAIGQFVNVATGSVGYLLTMSGHEREFGRSVLISAPVAIVAAFVLVPLWGAAGGAVATSLAIILQNLIAVFQVKKSLGVNTLLFWRGSHFFERAVMTVLSK